MLTGSLHYALSGQHLAPNRLSHAPLCSETGGYRAPRARKPTPRQIPPTPSKISRCPTPPSSTDLRWRAAIKNFDPAKPIPAETWKTLEESLVLTPSSYGLQPWKFLIITDKDLKARFLPARLEPGAGDRLLSLRRLRVEDDPQSRIRRFFFGADGGSSRHASRVDENLSGNDSREPGAWRAQRRDRRVGRTPGLHCARAVHARGRVAPC